MSTSLLSKESSTSPAMSEDEHEDVVPPDSRGKWTSPSRNFFPPELGMSSHGLGNLSLYSMKRLERQCCMHVCVQPERQPVTRAAHRMRNEFALGSRTGVRGSFMALTFASGSRAVPHSTAHDDVHGAVHDASTLHSDQGGRGA